MNLINYKFCVSSRFNKKTFERRILNEKEARLSENFTKMQNRGLNSRQREKRKRTKRSFPVYYY